MPGGEPRSARRGWLLGQPYRPFFLIGAIWAAVAVALWAAWIEAGFLGRSPALHWALPPAPLHAITLIWGVLSFYVFGFLLTAYVRWVQASEPSPRALVALVTLLAAGQASFGLSALVDARLVWAGVGLEGAALVWLIAFLGRGLRRSRSVERLQPALVLAGLSAGVAGLGLTALGLFTRDAGLRAVGTAVGLYGYLLFVVLAVGQRIIPFFTRRAQGLEPSPRPRGFLLAALVLVAARIAAVAFGARPWAAEAAAWVDAGLLAALVWEVHSWRPGPALANPMVAVLYLALAWIGVGLLLGAAAPLREAPPFPLDTPMLHALAVGGLATLVVGISTRVALGHADRPVRADAWALAVFALIQAAALLRVLPPLLDPLDARVAHWAGLPWGLAFAIWAIRFGPLLVRDPARGRAGPPTRSP